MKNLISKSTILGLIAALACAVLLNASPAMAASGPNALDGLKVSYWPEYDKPSVLLIYRGKVSATSLPATVRLLVPKNALIAATSTIDTNGQFDYDKAWATHKTKTVGDFQELTFETTNPEFQAEVYYMALGDTVSRKLPLLFAAPANIDNLRVEIQEPKNATKFKTEPATKDISTGDGFQYHNYTYDNVPAGRELSFNVSYDKSGSEPSVNSQQQTVTGSPGSRGSLTVILLSLVGVIAIGIAASIWRVKTVAAKKKPLIVRPIKKRNKQQNSQKSQKSPSKGKFCADCGEALKEKDSFCPGCGTQV